KTLIAAALATVVAAPAAIADVSVSGQVKVTVVDVDGVSDWAPSFDNSITFKASEDLGNGMSAFAQITVDTDEGGSAATAGGSKDQKLGLKGSFGTVVLGRMETLSQSVMGQSMDDGAGTLGIETSNTDAGRVNAIAYISPTVNGIHVAAAGTMDATDDMIEHTDILVAYDNGPLSVKAAYLDAENAPLPLETISIGATYKMGDAKLSFLTADNDVTDKRDNMYRVDYTMGNNVILLGHLDADAANSDVTSLKLSHKMSKRTAVWIGARDKDSGADGTHFGMIHKF
ncbi:MAG: porin, partial [Gammaproteobacteria bacterium]|nr:porin [Gammaproteobacteria bacterium]